MWLIGRRSAKKEPTGNITVSSCDCCVLLLPQLPEIRLDGLQSRGRIALNDDHDGMSHSTEQQPGRAFPQRIELQCHGQVSFMTFSIPV